MLAKIRADESVLRLLVEGFTQPTGTVVIAAVHPSTMMLYFAIPAETTAVMVAVRGGIHRCMEY